MNAICTLIALASFCLIAQPLVAAEPRIEIELVMEGKFAATAQQQWLRLFSELRADDIRIHRAGDDDKAEIRVAGTKANPVYHVVGLLRGANELVLPDAKFTSRDSRRIGQWLDKLRANGPEAMAAGAKLPFGLTPAQLANVNSDLSRRITFGTAELTPNEVLQKLAPTLDHRLVIDTSSAARLAAAGPLGEELQGVTAGTAMAYLLRPSGLSMLPRRDQRWQPEYAVVKPVAGQTAWPVGWPLGKKKPIDVLPALFEKLEVEIDDVPLSEALAAIGERLKAPILFDHHALAKHGIDIEETRVSLPEGKSWYSRILDRVLYQAKLQGEWRLDEGGSPFLWVTTQKK
jgi:hypothetical protein